MESTGHQEDGQAGVEAALTLPMLVFLALGTLQLFLMLQARFLAEYGVFRAARAGSLNHGDCKAMTHAAVVSVLPALERTNDPASVEAAFKKHANNTYDDVRLVPGRNGASRHRGQIVELWRDVYFGRTREVFLSTASLPQEDQAFDQPDHLMRLETRMIFWYRMKIPFADWVLGRMFLAHYRLQSYDFANPLSPVEARAGWPEDSGGLTFLGEPWPGGPLDQSMLAFAQAGHFLFPIRVTWSMRMMTPIKKKYFDRWGCAL